MKLFPKLSLILLSVLTSQNVGKANDVVELKQLQSLVTGLMVRELGVASFMGKASQMNTTAVPNKGGGRATLKFNQDVGGEMQTALSEVQKFLTVRHAGWPDDFEIEISFEEKYGPKDGPSAALACGLMLESLLSGVNIYAQAAVTGDMNADGSVQPVGGVPDKIRGATAAGCPLIIMPKACESQMIDAALMSGIESLYSIQIFSVANFNDAWAVAVVKQDERMTRAIETFTTIQQALRAQANPMSIMRHPKMIERLTQVISDAPNHFSANLLLEYSMGRAPKILTPRGSLTQIDAAADALIKAIQFRTTDQLAPDTLASAISRLNRLRTYVDPRTVPYMDSLVDLGNEIRKIKNLPPRSAPERAKAVNRINEYCRSVESAASLLSANRVFAEEISR